VRHRAVTYKLANRLNQASSFALAQVAPRTVLFVLRNPIYMGVTYFNRTQRVHISGKRHTYVKRPRASGRDRRRHACHR